MAASPRRRSPPMAAAGGGVHFPQADGTMPSGLRECLPDAGGACGGKFRRTTMSYSEFGATARVSAHLVSIYVSR